MDMMVDTRFAVMPGKDNARGLVNSMQDHNLDDKRVNNVQDNPSLGRVAGFAWLQVEGFLCGILGMVPNIFLVVQVNTASLLLGNMHSYTLDNTEVGTFLDIEPAVGK